MEQKRVRRENWIDAAKVIAIGIVLLNHSGLIIPGINFWGGMFYVPSFFLLAGYTYAPKKESWGSFVRRKAKRLLVPYFVANGLLFFFFFIKDCLTGNLHLMSTVISLVGIVYGRNQLLQAGQGPIMWAAPMQNVNLMLNLNAPTWFLPALFLVLIVGDGLFRLMGGQKKKMNLFVALLAVIMLLHHYLSPFLLPWGLDILPYLLVLFLIGYEWKEKECFAGLEKCSGMRQLLTILGILLILIAAGLFNGSFNLSVSYFGKSVTFSLIAAITSTFLLLFVLRKLGKKVPGILRGIAGLGKYTLTILCYHYFIMQMFFTAVSVIVQNFWNENGIAQACVRLLGIILSVVICVFLDWGWHKTTKSFGKKMEEE
jgi:fucose 4-O-acetylase-like acetyltransferase